jgi:hypothetical protein
LFGRSSAIDARTRKDPVAILEAQAKTRLPFLVPIRYARMLASPFAFLRGSAAVMAADLANTPVTGITVQACGDMHVANFGVFASAERNLVFGINDFDETLPGAWEWDLKRLAASAAVVARFLGGDEALAEECSRAAVRSYRKRMRGYAEMGHLEVWYSRIDEEGLMQAISPGAREAASRILAKARQRGHVQVLDKMAELVDAVTRWRRARGLPALKVTSVLCGRPDCKREHGERQREGRRRYWRSRYRERAKVASLPKPPTGPWRCAVCGVGWAGAMAARRRRGLRAVDPKRHRTCGAPACRDAWRRTYSEALWSPPQRKQ